MILSDNEDLPVSGQNEICQNRNVSKPIGTRKQYYLDKKKEVLDFLSINKNQSETARIFNLEPRLVCDWNKNRSVIEAAQFKRSKTRVIVKSRAKFPEVDERLLKWFDEQREANRCITGIDLKLKALEFHGQIYENQVSVGFSASDGWLDGWLKRNNKTLRRVTSTGRDLPSNFGAKLADFLNISIESFRNLNRDRTKIFNMDETSIYLDCPSRYTYATKGSKRIRVETNGAELVRISAVFTGSAAGEKLPIFLLVPRTKDLENYVPPNNIRLIYKTGGIFNEDTICDYLTRILANQHQSCLFLDSARCHLTEKVKTRIGQLGIIPIFIPPRMTNLLQPADVCWFAKVKKAYCTKWTEWTRDTQKTYTIHGNSKSPGYVLAIQWLSEIWNNFESHLIKNSFDSCGITSQETLHSTLCDLVNRNLKFGSFVDNIEEEEAVMGFNDEDNFDENLIDFVGNNEAAQSEISPQVEQETPSLSLVNSINPVDPTPVSTGAVGRIEQSNNCRYPLRQLDFNIQTNETQTQTTDTRLIVNSIETSMPFLVSNALEAHVTQTNTITKDQSATIQKKRGRKRYPRDENGHIIRPKKS